MRAVWKNALGGVTFQIDSADGRQFVKWTPPGSRIDLSAEVVRLRWAADLAIATWSTQWNYGPGWEEPLLDAYGIKPDPERITYYRLLWELSD